MNAIGMRHGQDGILFCLARAGRESEVAAGGVAGGSSNNICRHFPIFIKITEPTRWAAIIWKAAPTTPL